MLDFMMNLNHFSLSAGIIIDRMHIFFIIVSYAYATHKDVCSSSTRDRESLSKENICAFLKCLFN